MSKSQIMAVLLLQEIRRLLSSKILWGLLIILSLLVGYSFVQAVDLFSQASRTALSYPDLASGMNPMEGVFIPTFGSYYLVETLLLPFLVIWFVGEDKQNGTLKLLLQLPLSSFTLNGIKVLSLAVVWLLFLIPGISVVIIWKAFAGTVYFPELITLLLGHTLYALTITTIALLATAITDSMATAAMICLAVTIGSWVLDFAAGSGGIAGLFGRWSMTTLLRQFESGLLSSVSIAIFVALSLFFFLTASINIYAERRKFMDRFRDTCWAFGSIVIVLLAAMQFPRFLDVSENQRHSFNPADVQALQQMNETLTITVHLSREDGRFYDFKHEILVKLQRIVPKLKIVVAETGSDTLFSSGEGDDYGLIEYDYGGKHDKSYSNSRLEVLPLLHALAGHKVVPDQLPVYSGHPLVVDVSSARWWFYLFLPMFYLLSSLFFQ